MVCLLLAVESQAQQFYHWSVALKLCILHCGHPKTGTSSLQRYLAANADNLAEHGILYPIIQRPPDRPPAMPWAGFQNGAALKALARPKQSTRKFDELRQITQGA